MLVAHAADMLADTTCRALPRSFLQPFLRRFNRPVKLLLQHFAFWQFGHVFGHLDAAFVQLQQLYLLASFSGTED